MRSPTLKVLSELTFDVHIGGDDDEFKEGKGEVLYSFKKFNLILFPAFKFVWDENR